MDLIYSNFSSFIQIYIYISKRNFYLAKIFQVFDNFTLRI